MKQTLPKHKVSDLSKSLNCSALYTLKIQPHNWVDDGSMWGIKVLKKNYARKTCEA
nr:MAG TPA: hypothetical protein [Caudoviricetes sp.]